MPRPLDVMALRRCYPALARQHGGMPAVFFDGPAGSQVPQAVADAVRRHLLEHNANHGGPFATSRETDAMVDAARLACADLFGAASPEQIVFGPNMTTLAFHLARSLARTWRKGDEVLVTDSDHDANIAPWVLAAADAGATVQRIGVREDGTLDRDDFARKLSPRTRLLALGAASNLTGTIHPVAEFCREARAQGALTFVDAVHHAAHCRMDVNAWHCDFAAASAYKFFGPHLGILCGRLDLLESLEACKVRPAPDHGPEKWQTGTAPFEAIAGTLAAIEHLARLGQEVSGHGDRRAQLDAAFAATFAHERGLVGGLLAALERLPVRVIGITDPARLDERCATVSLVPSRGTPQQLCHALAGRGIFCWAGNSYAVALTTALGLEPHGVLRLGLLHYNTRDEVARCARALGELLACAGAPDS